jgi:hypothetical protein
MSSDRYKMLKHDLAGKIRPLMNPTIVGAVHAAVGDGISAEHLAQLIRLALGGKTPWSPVEDKLAGKILREEAGEANGT